MVAAVVVLIILLLFAVQLMAARYKGRRLP